MMNDIMEEPEKDTLLDLPQGQQVLTVGRLKLAVWLELSLLAYKQES